MKLRCWIPFVVISLAACGKAAPVTPPETPTPDPTPTPTPEPSTGIHGTLTVHVPGWAQVPPEFIDKATVLLGDGSRFRQPLDAKGDAHFVDAAIVGPQDVTVVVVAKSDTPAVGVSTFLGLTQPEVWLNAPSSEPPSPPPPPPKLATVSGKVTGVTTDHPVFIFATGAGFSGGASVNPDGTFRFDVLSATPGNVDLVVREEDPSVDYDNPQALRAGRLRNISLSQDQVLTGLALALDQRVDQTLSVTVDGLQPYATDAYVLLHFLEGNLGFFSTRAKGMSPLSLSTLAMSAPFDTTRRALTVSAGAQSSVPAGSAFALKAIDNGSTASIRLPAPMSLSSPQMGTCSSPPSTSRSGLSLHWSIDGAANQGYLEFQPNSSGASLTWTVTAPASITTFTPFPLPAEVSPLASLPAGEYTVSLTSSYRGDIPDYASLFAQTVPHASVVDERKTNLLGCVRLQ